MPQRSFWREMALISVPLLLIGGVFGWGQWQKRLRTPRIALAVRFDIKQIPAGKSFGFSPDEKLKFEWVADLKGGPRPGYRFGWNESLVVKTRRGSVVVWQMNTLPKGWQLDAVSGSLATPTVSGTFSSFQSLNHVTHYRNYELDGLLLPLDTQSLSWHGEMVAVPASDADIWQSPLPHATLQNLSLIAGAAKWQQTIDLPINARTLDPVLLRSQKSNNPAPASKDELKVEILSRLGNRRAFRRVIAFDGTTKRVLWTDADKLNAFCQGIGNGGYRSRDGESLFFDIGRIPISWGEIVFLCDTVFDINKRARTVAFYDNKLDERALAAFEQKTGGYRVSRRLVLCPREAPTIVSHH